ncbi:tetratricopeptide repeat protein [Noviherbaspirillum malthae]|uniref:tetratricopeptide repeat protein n=1 Tax=Noviherbaspirillum malthae TaxID=1260987 RepID=UPI001890B164|nr:SEL1-like repeat protein [Noviherbaspirillum malthae]
MNIVSIATAASLIDQSERTLRRRIVDGSLTRLEDESGSNRTMIPFAAIKEQIVIPVVEEDLALIAEADAGRAEAQNDLALLFLSHDKPRSALYWLELAAKQDYPDAMHWLGRCYLEGNGTLKDDNLGLMWLAKAAAHGHAISQVQMEAMRNSFITNK